MKKNLLLVAALFCGVTMSAQTVWTSASGCSSDGKTLTDPINFDGTTTASNIAVSIITWGDGILTPTTCQRDYKTSAGVTERYVSDTEALIKWVPNLANGVDETIKTIAPAYARGQYVAFPAEINNTEDFFELSALKFDAVRLGTDAVRINVCITGSTMEGLYDSGWLITGDNWEAVSGGIGSWTDGDTADGNLIPGYQPSREDGSKPNSSPDKGCSSLNIPLYLPADLYELEVRIVVYGIANNKALALHNVTLVNNDGSSIKLGVTVDENVAPEYFTVSGVQVAEPVKGVNIVKRTMTDGSVKFTKEMR